MKRRWKILIAVFVLLLLTVTVYRTYYSIQFNRRVEGLAEAGFPVSLDDLEKACVLPDDVPNAADVYIEAFSQYQEPNEHEKEMLPYHQGYEQSASYATISKT